MADPTSCGSEVLFRRFLKIFFCGIRVKLHDTIKLYTIHRLTRTICLLIFHSQHRLEDIFVHVKWCIAECLFPSVWIRYSLNAIVFCGYLLPFSERSIN